MNKSGITPLEVCPPEVVSFALKNTRYVHASLSYRVHGIDFSSFSVLDHSTGVYALLVPNPLFLADLPLSSKTLKKVVMDRHKRYIH